LQGRYEESVSCYERALKIYDKEFGVGHIRSAHTIMNMGLVLKAQRRSTLAEEHLLRAYHIFKSNLGDNHQQTQNARSLAYSGFRLRSLFDRLLRLSRR
jgi:tetratricopeptide (TPR) repeat protein